MVVITMYILLCRYSLILRCWQADSSSRPKMAEISAELSDIVSTLEAEVNDDNQYIEILASYDV